MASKRRAAAKSASVRAAVGTDQAVVGSGVAAVGTDQAVVGTGEVAVGRRSEAAVGTGEVLLPTPCLAIVQSPGMPWHTMARMSPSS